MLYLIIHIDGPIWETDTIPFYDTYSKGSGYLLPTSFIDMDDAKTKPNNYTTFSNIVYKNITEVPVGVIMLADPSKELLSGYSYESEGRGNGLSGKDTRICKYYFIYTMCRYRRFWTNENSKIW